MESDEKISKLLVETKAYSDLEQPVILTSGELGIYYINTEKLLQDDGEWKKYGDDSQSMIKHAIEMTSKNPGFGEVIDILANKVKEITSSYAGGLTFAISGGQRRDWLFSGPIAYKLFMPHVSLHKQKQGEEDKIEALLPDHEPIDNPNFYVVHVADLITEGSSVYRVENGKELGWVPMLRNKGITIDSLVAVVTRLQGGEERLNEIGVTAHPFVAIDENFVMQYSKYPERAVAYMKSPREWSENYLRENNALTLIETFDPDGGKLDRAKKFLGRYGNILAESDKWNELDSEVKKRYGVHLGQISGDID